MKKIKVFLGGYINSTNAQNINCRSIAKYIDNKKFEIIALKLYSGDLATLNIRSLETIRCFYPHKISKYIGYYLGILKCDIAYLPKGECHNWCMFWLTLFNKKSFSTIEGILDDTNIKKAIKTFGSEQKVLNKYKKFKNLYSITSYMKSYNLEHRRVISCSNILYLGTETSTFTLPERVNQELKDIIMIGNHLKYKGINDYFLLAKNNPTLNFHIVGSGNGEIDVNFEINKLKLSNCIYHGALDHQQMKEVLKNIQLHIFASRTEGFPKVTLETAAAGIPSIVYSDYGANEWIDDHKSGFVVDTVEQMQKILDELLLTPELLNSMSANSIDLAKRFDWKVLIKNWEKEIMSIVTSK